MAEGGCVVPLEILLAMVVLGIAGIAVLTIWLGLSQQRALSEDTAQADWLRHFPDDVVQSVWISSDAHAALCLTDAGPGLLWAVGADTTARRLGAARVTDTRGGLDIVFDDFTAPRVHLRLYDDARLVWKRLMEAA